MIRLTLFAAFVIGLAFLLTATVRQAKACGTAGGTLVKAPTSTGYACVPRLPHPTNGAKP